MEEAEGNPVLGKIPSGNGESLIHTVTSPSQLDSVEITMRTPLGVSPCC